MAVPLDLKPSRPLGRHSITLGRRSLATSAVLRGRLRRRVCTGERLAVNCQRGHSQRGGLETGGAGKDGARLQGPARRVSPLRSHPSSSQIGWGSQGSWVCQRPCPLCAKRGDIPSGRSAEAGARVLFCDGPIQRPLCRWAPLSGASAAPSAQPSEFVRDQILVALPVFELPDKIERAGHIGGWRTRQDSNL